MGLFDKKKAQPQAADTATPHYGLLLVDDELFNLTTLATLLEEDYRVVTAASGAEALRVLADPVQAAGIQVVVSDQRMPGMTGVELLSQVRARAPHIKRVLLTGYTDAEAIISAINEAAVYKYVRKPIDSTDLRLTLARAVEVWQLEHDHQALLVRLQHALDKLAVLDADKLKFLRYLAHEMNTPLNWLSATQALDRESLGWDVQEILGFVDQGQERLQQLIEAVLRYFQAAALEPAPAQDLIDLPVLLRQRLGNARETFPDVVVTIEAPPTLNLASQADMLTETLDHLLENACTHAGHCAEPTVTIQLVLLPDAIRLRIHNGGRGVDGPALARLFQPFHFGSDHGERGFGMSLATARALAVALGGDLHAESDGGNSGVACYLRLPLREQN